MVAAAAAARAAVARKAVALGEEAPRRRSLQVCPEAFEIEQSIGCA